MNFQINPTMIMLMIYGTKNTALKRLAVFNLFTSITARRSPSTLTITTKKIIYFPVKSMAFKKVLSAVKI